MWDEEDEKLMCKALGYHGDDVCPECGYEICHCDDIYEASLRSYKCVCKKCGKEFIITSESQPSVNFCDDCHYEAVTVCKKCGKEVNVNIISASRESHVENSTYVCEECQKNILPKGFLVTCEEWNLCSTEELAEKKSNHEKYYCPKCHSVNCRCADIEYAKETQECCEKDSYYEKKCEKCGSVFLIIFITNLLQIFVVNVIMKLSLFVVNVVKSLRYMSFLLLMNIILRNLYVPVLNVKKKNENLNMKNFVRNILNVLVKNMKRTIYKLWVSTEKTIDFF